MAKLSQLQFEAHKTATERGHILQRWERGDSRHYTAECAKCDAWATVTPRPAPNEILAGGPALAVACPWKA